MSLLYVFFSFQTFQHESLLPRTPEYFAGCHRSIVSDDPHEHTFIDSRTTVRFLDVFIDNFIRKSGYLSVVIVRHNTEGGNNLRREKQTHVSRYQQYEILTEE